MSQKKILIISDSVKRKTGYSTVARNIIKKLQDRYEIAQLGLADIPTNVPYNIHYYSMLKNHDKCCKRGKVIEYYPRGSKNVQYLKLEKGVPLHDNQIECKSGGNDGNDNYGYISVYFVVQHFRPDIVIPINDVWGLYNLVHLRNRKCFKLMPYIAIDSECMFPQIEVPNPNVKLPPVNAIHTVENSDYPVVFTDWAQKVLNKTARAMMGKDLKKMYTIPHGVDASVWKPIDKQKRTELRKKFFNIDSDKIFLIGAVARNQPRKRLDALMPVLRTLIDKYEKKIGKTFKLYFHCSLEDKLGWPLPWLAQYYGVLDRCIFDKNLKPGEGPTEEELNDRVNCFDAHVVLANSEGWALPALETLAAGIPNIWTDYSAHADWGKDAIYLCKVAAFEHEPRTGFIKAIADTNDCAHKLSLLAGSKKFWEEWSEKGIKLGHKLDWANVTKMWEDLIDSVDVSDLDPGRYDEPFMADPTIQDFSLKYFPKPEEEYVSSTPSV